MTRRARTNRGRKAMALDEFARIAAYLAPLSAGHAGAFGLRDDAAVFSGDAASDSVVTTDALVAAVHYFPADPPDAVARKALRVNLSDLAAMGAAARGFTLAMALSRDRDAAANEARVAAFAAGLAVDIAAFDCALWGGDSVATPGPEMLSITAIGAVPAGAALRRAGAQVGDAVYVSGTVGDAALGLRLLSDAAVALPAPQAAAAIDRFQLPRPRLALGQALRGVATACLDVSDGLAQDLGHLCAASEVGARVFLDRLPLSTSGRAAADGGLVTLADLATGGDDYELIFTAPARAGSAVAAAAERAETSVTLIGEITAGAAVDVVDQSGATVDLGVRGYRHA